MQNQTTGPGSLKNTKWLELKKKKFYSSALHIQTAENQRKIPEKSQTVCV